MVTTHAGDAESALSSTVCIRSGEFTLTCHCVGMGQGREGGGAELLQWKGQGRGCYAGRGQGRDCCAGRGVCGDKGVCFGVSALDTYHYVIDGRIPASTFWVAQPGH